MDYLKSILSGLLFSAAFFCTSCSWIKTDPKTPEGVTCAEICQHALDIGSVLAFGAPGEDRKYGTIDDLACGTVCATLFGEGGFYDAGCFMEAENDEQARQCAE